MQRTHKGFKRLKEDLQNYAPFMPQMPHLRVLGKVHKSTACGIRQECAKCATDYIEEGMNLIEQEMRYKWDIREHAVIFKGALKGQKGP